MAKKTKPPIFQDVLATLGSRHFDVAPASAGSRPAPGSFRVGKYGCAAEIGPAKDGGVNLLARPGWVLHGEIARVTDRGYQKFLKTTRLEIPVTAEQLRAIHTFSEELKEATGGMSLYNESLGTTSDRYVYDRVLGRE